MPIHHRSMLMSQTSSMLLSPMSWISASSMLLSPMSWISASSMFSPSMERSWISRFQYLSRNHCRELPVW
jgi:hypothetical protein